jgi:hypothetical protein
LAYRAGVIVGATVGAIEVEVDIADAESKRYSRLSLWKGGEDEGERERERGEERAEWNGS